MPLVVENQRGEKSTSPDNSMFLWSSKWCSNTKGSVLRFARIGFNVENDKFSGSLMVKC